LIQSLFREVLQNIDIFVFKILLNTYLLTEANIRSYPLNVACTATGSKPADHLSQTEDLAIVNLPIRFFL